MLTKWEVDKVGINEVGVDKVGINKVGVDKVGINKVGVDKVGIDEMGINHVSYFLENVGQIQLDQLPRPTPTDTLLFLTLYPFGILYPLI